MSKLDTLLAKYQAKFGEQFPLMLCRGMTDDTIYKVVQQALDDGKPYDPELDPDADY